MLCVISGSPHSVFLEILTSLGVFRASARIEFSIISVFCFSPTRWRLHISSYLYYCFPYVCQACLEHIFSQCTLHICWLFYFIFRVRIGIFYWIFYCIKMSSHQASSKPRSSKCRHFCFPFDLHNYCPTCRESGKEDNSCVTNLSTCNVCSQFTEEQKVKIKNRHRYTRKQKSDVNTSKDDLDLLGTMMNLLLVLKQTLRVLLKIYFPHPHVPNHYALNLCH